MLDIWAACAQRIVPAALEGVLIRMVESQERSATNRIVDDLAEQAQLEELLEASKPRLRDGTAHLHYLLATPFRYPPLRHGSRFGPRHAPGLLYGGERVATTLAEVGYYRFVFWDGFREPPPAGAITSQHTAFGAAYRTGRGLRLQAPPFDAYAEHISHPACYDASQRLGEAMREAGIEAFQYRSARDPHGGLGIGLFVPAALPQPVPAFQQSWLCETRAEQVSFLSVEAGVHSFSRTLFLHQGEFPRPAV